MKNTTFCFTFLFLTCVTSDLNDCTRDYSDPTDGVHFTRSGVEEEIIAPWLVAIGISRKNYEFTLLCSGNIITKNYILSAAHCFISERIKPSHIRAGANYIDSVFAEQRKILEVNRHPDYDSINKTYYFDLAIITINKEFEFSSKRDR